MKTLISSIAALLLGTTLSYGYNSWGIYASYWDTDEGDSVSGAGLKISAEMVPGVQLELRGTYFEDLADQAEGLEVLPLEGGLALEFPGSSDLSFLAGGGIGYYLMDGVAGVDDEIGFYLSAGLEWNLQQNAALFGEAMYRVVSADNAGEDGADVDLDGIGFNAGLLIKW